MALSNYAFDGSYTCIASAIINKEASQLVATLSIYEDDTKTQLLYLVHINKEFSPSDLSDKFLGSNNVYAAAYTAIKTMQGFTSCGDC